MQAVGAHGNESGNEEKPVGVGQTEAAVLSLAALWQLCAVWKEAEGQLAAGTGLGWVVSSLCVPERE